MYGEKKGSDIFMLTPIDIQKQDFAVKMRGYSADEVDDFLDMVGADYEKLYKENIELKDKVTTLQESLEQYKAMEATLRDSIMLAQNAAEEIKRNAAERADNVTNDAQMKASDIIRQANDEVLTKKKELSDIQLQFDEYKSQMKSMCSRIGELIEKM